MIVFFSSQLLPSVKPFHVLPPLFCRILSPLNHWWLLGIRSLDKTRTRDCSSFPVYEFDSRGETFSAFTLSLPPSLLCLSVCFILEKGCRRLSEDYLAATSKVKRLEVIRSPWFHSLRSVGEGERVVSALTIP